jgi:rubrerythrin
VEGIRVALLHTITGEQEGGSTVMEMNKHTYQEILEKAILNEIEAFRFYREVAEKVENGFIKQMFEDFAKEEQMHRKILEGFRDRSDMGIHFARIPDFHVSGTLDTPVQLSIDMKPADAIALAIKKEEAAMTHYTHLAEACTDLDQRKVFLELAAMERGHKSKMESAFVDVGYPEVW